MAVSLFEQGHFNFNIKNILSLLDQSINQSIPIIIFPWSQLANLTSITTTP